MYVLVIIFIVLALIIGLFSAVLVGREVVIEEKNRRKKKNDTSDETTTVTTPTPTPVVTVQPPVLEETAVAVDAEIDNGTVAFSTGTQSLDEKYLALSPEYKGYYDEIVRSAMAVDDSKRYKNAAYEEYKVGKNRLVRLKIKRGIVVCELVIPNLTFKNYISNNKVAMKQAPATIKVVDEASLNAVKDSIGIAVKAIEEERAYKKEQAKIRRKQKRTTER